VSLDPWDELRRETLCRYKVFHVERVWRRSPRTGAEIGLFLVDTPDWVNVVPWTVDDELILVRQFRHGTGRFHLEIPGGLIDRADRDPAHAAERELREETGYAAESVRAIGSMAPNPAIQTNTLHTFMAQGCRRVGPPQLDPGEDLEVVLVPRAEVPELVRRGEIDHALVLAGLYFAGLQP